MAKLPVEDTPKYFAYINTAWSVFAPILAGYIGYWFRGREFRKLERSSRVDDIAYELTSLSTVVSLYWSRDTIDCPSADLDVAHEAEIIGRLQTINVFVEDVAIFFREPPANLVRAAMIELRQAATSGDFAATRGHGRSSNAISRTIITAANLRTQLRKGLRG